MTAEFPQDRVFARHARRTGAVLIIGAGAVGSGIAALLVRAGISPLWILDKDYLEVENVTRNYLSAEDVGRSKARRLAAKLRRELPWSRVEGIHADFMLDLPDAEQRRLVRQANVVVAATDEADCQRSINRVCLEEGVRAVFPAVWVDPGRVRDAEVGEILWMVPGSETPCYECWVSFRQASADAQAARGAGLDTQQVSLATAQVVLALLDPSNPTSTILDPDRTAIYVHGFTPTSPGVRATFPSGGMYSRNVRVPFPPAGCPVCHGQEARTPVMVRRTAQPVPGVPAHREQNRQPRLRVTGAAAAAILVLVLGVIITVAMHASSIFGAHGAAPSAKDASAPTTMPAAPSSTAPAPSSAPPSSPNVQSSSTPAPINFKNIGLACFEQCGVVSASPPSDVHLEVTGISAAALERLCRRGDTVHWTDSHNRDLTSMKLGWACGQQLVDIDIPGMASITIPALLDGNFQPVPGPWTITFSLLDPSGRTLASASYHTTVADCTAPGSGCSN